MSKKLILGLVLSLSSLSSFAQTACAKKQILAARKAFSQEYGVSLSKVKLVAYNGGFWTEMLGNNTGSDEVIVAAARPGADAVVETYRVGAKQIGQTADCTVFSVKSI